MSDALTEFTHAESERCGYIVTEGFRPCDHCGGGGLHERETCPECNGAGEHVLTEAEILWIEAGR